MLDNTKLKPSTVDMPSPIIHYGFVKQVGKKNSWVFCQEVRLCSHLSGDSFNRKKVVVERWPIHTKSVPKCAANISVSVIVDPFGNAIIQ